MNRVLVSLVLAGVLIGCGGSPSDKPVELVYRAGASAAQAVPIVRARLARVGITAPEVRAKGNEITVRVHGATDAEDAKAVLAPRGDLGFYDWEPNVLDRTCRPRPADQLVTGGASAGQHGAGTMDYATATARAKRCHAMAVRAEYDGTPPADRDAQWYVLGGRPAVTGKDITHPAQEFDEAAGGTGQPTVTFGFSAPGRRGFQALSR